MSALRSEPGPSKSVFVTRKFAAWAVPPPIAEISNAAPNTLADQRALLLCPFPIDPFYAGRRPRVCASPHIHLLSGYNLPPRGRALQQVFPDESVQVPVQHALRVPHLEPGAVVLHSLDGMERVATDLGAPFGRLGLSAFLGELLGALVLLEGEETGLQKAHRDRLVLGLGALVLALDDDTRRDVRDAHGRVGLVDVLAAGA